MFKLGIFWSGLFAAASLMLGGCGSTPNPQVGDIEAGGAAASNEFLRPKGFTLLKTPSSEFTPGHVYYRKKASDFETDYFYEELLCDNPLYSDMTISEYEQNWPEITVSRAESGGLFVNLLGGLLGGGANGSLGIGANNVASITMQFPSKVKILEIRQSTLLKEHQPDRDCAATVRYVSSTEQDSMLFIRAVALSKDMTIIFTLNKTDEDSEAEAAIQNPFLHLAAFQEDGGEETEASDGVEKPECGTYFKAGANVPGQGGGRVDYNNCNRGEWKIVLNDPEPVQVIGFRPYKIEELRSNQTRGGVAPFTAERTTLIGRDLEPEEAEAIKPLDISR